MNKLIIYGASGHGKVIADIAKRNGYRDIVFFDDDPDKKELDGYQVMHEFPDDDYDLIVGIGDNRTRQMISERTNKELVTLIHPDSSIGENVSIGQGTVVMAGAVINSGTVIGRGVIINTCASVDHDNRIGDYCHISVNAHAAGTVHIGKRCFIGMGSNIINNITICDDVLLGAGAVVIDDIMEEGTYVGVPARLANESTDTHK